MISRVVSLSRFHVGSSARSISGLLIRDLAIATLCCCHQDSSHGREYIFSSSHTFFSSLTAISVLVFVVIPAYILGSTTFSRELSLGKR